LYRDRQNIPIEDPISRQMAALLQVMRGGIGEAFEFGNLVL
jgi:hypothetical protein